MKLQLVQHWFATGKFGYNTVGRMSPLIQIAIVDAQQTTAFAIRSCLQAGGFVVRIVASCQELFRQDDGHIPSDDLVFLIATNTADAARDLVFVRERIPAQVPIVTIGAGLTPDCARELGANETLVLPTFSRDVLSLIRLLVVRNDDPVTGHKCVGDHFGVYHLLRLFRQLKRSGILRLYREQRVGEVHFSEGSIVHASLGANRGLPALHRLLLWNHGGFAWINEPLSQEREIPLETDELLPVCARFLQELRFGCEDLHLTCVYRTAPNTPHQKFPAQTKDVLALFDGVRTVIDAIEVSQLGALDTGIIAAELYGSGALVPVRTITRQANLALTMDEWLEIGEPALRVHPFDDTTPISQGAPWSLGATTRPGVGVPPSGPTHAGPTQATDSPGERQPAAAVKNTGVPEKVVTRQPTSPIASLGMVAGPRTNRVPVVAPLPKAAQKRGATIPLSTVKTTFPNRVETRTKHETKKAAPVTSRVVSSAASTTVSEGTIELVSSNGSIPQDSAVSPKAKVIVSEVVTKVVVQNTAQPKPNNDQVATVIQVSKDAEAAAQAVLASGVLRQSRPPSVNAPMPNERSARRLSSDAGAALNEATAFSSEEEAFFRQGFDVSQQDLETPETFEDLDAEYEVPRTLWQRLLADPNKSHKR